MNSDSSSSWVRGLLSLFAAEGVDTERLLRAAQFDPARIDDPYARFDADEVNRLWELAVQASGKPALGIDAGLAATHIDIEGVAFVMLASDTLRAGLEEFARYLALISSATTFALAPDPAGAWLVMGHTGYSRPVPPQRSAYSLLALLTVCRWITRQDIRPLEAQFSFPAPAAAAAYERAFGCRVRFGCADHRFLLSAADLAASLPSRDAALLALQERALDERLASLEATGIGRRVAEAIVARLPLGEPRRAEVAQGLGLTDRTLQRRLQAEHTSFQQLLDDARRSLAQRYLADRRYPLAQVAHLVGFSDESNFFRACKRWFGAPPGQVREAQQGAQPPA